MPSKRFKQFLSVFYYTYLVIYPVFSALSGVVLVLAGLFTWFFWTQLNVEGSQDEWLTTILGFIIVGVTLTILPFILCCAMSTRTNWIAMMYVVITMVLLVTEMTFGIYLRAVPGLAMNNTRKSLTTTFDNASFDDSSAKTYSRARATVDMIQLHFHCCGVDGPKYWEDNRNMSSASLPLSCCGEVGQNATCPVTTAWRDGCLQKSTALVVNTSLLLFNIILCIASVKMIGILFFVIRHDWTEGQSEELTSLLNTHSR